MPPKDGICTILDYAVFYNHMMLACLDDAFVPFVEDKY